jgi:sugar phosphate isomerase/epimerase
MSRITWGIGSFAAAWSVGVPGFERPARPLDAAGLLELAAQLGAPVVQICDNLPLDRMTASELAALAERAAALGLTIEVGCRSYEAPTLRAYREIATRLGSRLVRTLLAGPAAGTPQLISEARSHLLQVLPDYEAHGVVLAIENYEGYRCAELAALVAIFESPSLGVCLDTVNSLGALEPLDEVVDLLAPFTLSFHLKDFTIRRHPHTMGFEIIGASAGHGMLDVGAVLAALEQHGQRPNVILELWPPYQGDVESTAELERRWLREGAAYLADLARA